MPSVTPINPEPTPPTVRLSQSFLEGQRREIYRALPVLTITAESLPDEYADHRLALLVSRDAISAVNDELDRALVAAAREGRSHD